jgi:hypothetical protein
VLFSPLCMKRGGASKRRRLILLLSVGWVPPYLHPSGACLHLGTRVPVGSLNAAEGYTKPGLRLFSCTLANLLNIVRTRTWSVKRYWGIGTSWYALGTLSHGVTHEDVSSKVVYRTLQRNRHLLGNGPHKTNEFTRDGHGNNIGMFPLRHQAVVAFAQPDLRLPTDVLNHFGLVFEAQL